MPPPWIWPNLLSLDAPLIAVLWQALLARSFGIPLVPAGSAALGLTVWAIYLADRILDARAPAYPGEPARHRIYRAYPRAAAGLLCAVTLSDAALSFHLLRPQVLDNGLIVLAGVGLYLAALHALPGRVRVPKELLVAALFTTGTFLVAVSNAASPWATLWRPAVTYFLMCMANLVLIEGWEWRELRGARPDDGNRLTMWLARHYSWWTGVSIVWSASASSSWYTAIALSVTALLCLYAMGRRVPLEVRRTLADAMLLTPLWFLR